VNRLTIVILMAFVAWVAWRLITQRMRRTIVARELSTQYIVLDEETRPDGTRQINQARAVSVSFVDVSQYEIFLRVAHLLWHNFKARPKAMGVAILNVLRRPRA
jgi:hypothetical protein